MCDFCEKGKPLIDTNSKCENEEKRIECVEVSRKVLCLEENENE